MQSLRFALQPAVVDISVTWDLPKGVSVTVLSPSITTIFQGQRSLIYAQLTGQVGAAILKSEITILSDVFSDTELHKMYLILFYPEVFKHNNKHDFQYCKSSSEFRGSRGLCDGEVQPGRSSLSEPAPL